MREHLQTPLAEAAHRRVGEGVPRFVEERSRRSSRAGGSPAGSRDSGQSERLVAFSCKGRGFCPSCVVVDELGSRCEVNYVRRIMHLGTGAARPLAEFARANEPRQVVKFMARETRAGLYLRRCD